MHSNVGGSARALYAALTPTGNKGNLDANRLSRGNPQDRIRSFRAAIVRWHARATRSTHRAGNVNRYADQVLIYCLPTIAIRFAAIRASRRLPVPILHGMWDGQQRRPKVEIATGIGEL